MVYLRCCGMDFDSGFVIQVGASLVAKAAINSQARALNSLAVIQFNGSGNTKSEKDLRAGVVLCARAAFLSHVDTSRELDHCLQDGLFEPKNSTH
ncbi:hypothetical protein VNO78_20073 [Psophocarpus tetragonolobus]|uniref:Uncharacterized protein n=1 Tax=Psophocarpus tetragonolobus TaxID=3891 RepID=A0AAN9XGV8_PSOTE